MRAALQDLKDEEAESSSTDGLPDLTREAGPEKESVLPKPSQISWTQEGVTAADLASTRPDTSEQLVEQPPQKVCHM